MRLLVLGLAGCVSTSPAPAPQAYDYKPPEGQGQEAAMGKVRATVVARAEADRSGLHALSMSIPFGGDGDGTKLVMAYLERADRAGAHLVTDLAIYLQTHRGGHAVECRSEIVPEIVHELREHPAHYEQVAVQKPVTRTVTEYEYRCKPVSKMEMKVGTEHEQQCRTESHPVSRTRTVYRSEYDAYSQSYRQVPQTEHYTEYESRYECTSVPVSKSRMETVMTTECNSEPVTHTVTRYEFQYESRFVPARMEAITRQRLRELDPVCYTLPTAKASPALTPTNRIEGRLFTTPPVRR